MHELVWDDNADALEGLEYEFVSVFGQSHLSYLRAASLKFGKQHPKHGQGDFAVQPPVHVNCRCSAIVVDPEDPDDIRTGIQLKAQKPEGEGAYKTKVKVKGDKDYWKAEPAKGNTYAEYLAGSHRITQAQFFRWWANMRFVACRMVPCSS